MTVGTRPDDPISATTFIIIFRKNMDVIRNGIQKYGYKAKT